MGRAAKSGRWCAVGRIKGDRHELQLALNAVVKAHQRTGDRCSCGRVFQGSGIEVWELHAMHVVDMILPVRTDHDKRVAAEIERLRQGLRRRWEKNRALRERIHQLGEKLDKAQTYQEKRREGRSMTVGEMIDQVILLRGRLDDEHFYRDRYSDAAASASRYHDLLDRVLELCDRSEEPETKVAKIRDVVKYPPRQDEEEG